MGHAGLVYVGVVHTVVELGRVGHARVAWLGHAGVEWHEVGWVLQWWVGSRWGMYVYVGWGGSW